MTRFALTVSPHPVKSTRPESQLLQIGGKRRKPEPPAPGAGARREAGGRAARCSPRSCRRCREPWGRRKAPAARSRSRSRPRRGSAARAAPGARRGPGRAGRDGWRLRCAGPRRHAVPGAGHQPAGRPAAAGAGPGPVRRRRRHLGETGGAGERDGAERAAHGAGGLGRTLRPATRLLHRRGGLGGAEPAAQRPLLRRPHGEAGPRPRADYHPLLPTGALADRQEQNSHDVSVIP